MNDVTIRLTIPGSVVKELRAAAGFHQQSGGIHDELALAIRNHLRQTEEEQVLAELRERNAKLPRRERTADPTLVAAAIARVSRRRRGRS